MRHVPTRGRGTKLRGPPRVARQPMGPSVGQPNFGAMRLAGPIGPSLDGDKLLRPNKEGWSVNRSTGGARLPRRSAVNLTLGHCRLQGSNFWVCQEYRAHSGEMGRIGESSGSSSVLSICRGPEDYGSRSRSVDADIQRKAKIRGEGVRPDGCPCLDACRTARGAIRFPRGFCSTPAPPRRLAAVDRR
jgi:hypothetical protein